ncbi:MAG TPA: glycosyltransferase family 4 protein [Candidatus Limnocylindrales bacterium]|nr:glycosyltransferase family 4 protein [Candidatus Limnocylindrales bacterium]
MTGRGGNVRRARGLVVWFVNQYAGSPVHGMEFRHYELGRALVRGGHTVVVVSGSWSHLFTRPPETRSTYTLERVDGLTYCWVRVPRYRNAQSLGRVINMLAFAARLYRLPTRRLPRPDAVVVSSPSPFPILPAERWARRTGARLVFEVRDLWPLTLVDLGHLPDRHPLVLLVGWFERHAYRVADAVVSVLPAAGAYLEARGVPPSRIAIVPNGISPEAISATDPDVRSSAVTPADAGSPFVVGFVGTLGEGNALDDLIGAARLLAAENVEFVIVGQGSAESRLRLLAAGLPRVSFARAVAKASVPATIAGFDACYVGYHRSPLYRFGISPNKVFDYMAAGRPVLLASDAPCDPVTAAGAGLVVPPDDPAALAAAILDLRRSGPVERGRLGANGRRYVEREHSYDRLAERYLAVLEGGAA